MNRRQFFGAIATLFITPKLVNGPALVSKPLVVTSVVRTYYPYTSTLIKSDWIQLDKAVLYRAQERLRAWADMQVLTPVTNPLLEYWPARKASQIYSIEQSIGGGYG